jgi:hypothetical protein
VPVDTGIGVFVAVPDPDVESGAALLPRTRREDPLHCGGGYLFFDWAPLSGNASTGGAGVAHDHFDGRYWPKILRRSGLYVWDCGEHRCDRFPGTSLYRGNYCSDIWVTGNPAD